MGLVLTLSDMGGFEVEFTESGGNVFLLRERRRYVFVGAKIENSG